MKPTSIGIYIHFPFCITKCPYCDFNSYALSPTTVDALEPRFVNAVLKEMAYYAVLEDIRGLECASIFFGGGTPSLMKQQSVDALLQGVSEYFNVTAATEITLEANPASLSEPISKTLLAGLCRSGVNRLSFGVQSLKAEKLSFLGRWHTKDDTLKSIELARSAGFENLNLDFMYGVEGETLDMVICDLEGYVALQPSHISAYMLTIEPNTEFGKRSKKGRQFTVSDESFSDQYSGTQGFLESHGYAQYEVSNFSKASYPCIHNIGYWTGRPYLGLGPGAHSYSRNLAMGDQRWSNIKSPNKYIEKIESHGHAREMIESISVMDRAVEALGTQLRLVQGLQFARLSDEVRNLILSLRNTNSFTLLESTHYLLPDDSGWRIPKGKLVFADSIIEELCCSLEPSSLTEES